MWFAQIIATQSFSSYLKNFNAIKRKSVENYECRAFYVPFSLDCITCTLTIAIKEQLHTSYCSALSLSARVRSTMCKRSAECVTQMRSHVNLNRRCFMPMIMSCRQNPSVDSSTVASSRQWMRLMPMLTYLTNKSFFSFQCVLVWESFFAALIRHFCTSLCFCFPNAIFFCFSLFRLFFCLFLFRSLSFFLFPSLSLVLSFFFFLSFLLSFSFSLFLSIFLSRSYAHPSLSNFLLLSLHNATSFLHFLLRFFVMRICSVFLSLSQILSSYFHP